MYLKGEWHDDEIVFLRVVSLQIDDLSLGVIFQIFVGF